MLSRTRRLLAPPWLLLALPAILLATASCGPEPRSGEKQSAAAPHNVLLITVDTLRADALGFVGHRSVSTPTLDRLAAAGRIFDAAHAHCVTTLPSHASLLTGLYPYQHGVRHNGGYVLPDNASTLATRLREDGFKTAAFVGAFPLDARFGLDRGFDVYDDEYGEQAGGEGLFSYAERAGDEVVERAMSWWESQSGDRRFLWLHLFDPHAPYDPPEPFKSQFVEDPYLGEVSAVDFFLKPWLDRFLEGREEPTLVVFTSDHGESLGEHGEQTHGLFAYEATLAVPLVLWGPGVETGRDSRQARHIDVAPTILEALGLEALADSFGRSLLAPEEHHPQVSLFEALSGNLDFGWAPLRGVLKDTKKYIELPIPELYDLSADPAESSNLFPAQRSAARHLAQALPEEAPWPPERGEVTAAEAAHLSALGYLSGPTNPKKRYLPEDDPKNLVDLDRKVGLLADLQAAGQLQQAIELCREILEARPSMGVVYSYLTNFLLQTGDYLEVVRTIRSAQQHGVASRDLERQLALTLMTLGQAQEALAVLAPLAEDPRNGEARNLRALALTYLGRYAEAAALFDALVTEGGATGGVYENLAFLEIRRERYEAARTAARKALETDPGRVSSWNNLAVALYNLGRRAEAIEAWRQSLSLAPDDYDTLLNLGLVEAQSGNRDSARVALRRFLEIAPSAAYEAKRRQARELLRDLD